MSERREAGIPPSSERAMELSERREAVRWRRRADVLWRRSLDAVILLPEGLEEAVTLPDTGAVVWDLLEAPATLAELVDTLADLYGADPGVVGEDLMRLLGELEALGAVSAAP